ncbi:D-alanyl-D-alanine carboxypeptidase/D-alanyl-D-alanine endopeptidase [Terribacillus saccharophilus]|uniref:D-alanyl-D-alanine carboxypeptidase/D-alanyl-D-alanine endopeptidase n=1 Tax=Terribacillus saccharophilus TaxID=361277 RepID=UPI001473B18A|nr:D-alanyl-D-alanine carboxypeptidase/D-alanyl-D-alanine-endopeptidase [Terribacillus goriensis]
MLRKVMWVLALGLLLFTCMIPHTHVHVAGKEDKMIDRLTDYLANEEQLQGAAFAIHITDEQLGKTIFEKNADQRMRPASNMKLLTGAAVLDELGQDHRFETIVATDGQIKDDQLNGNLYLIGKGDTSLTYEDIQRLANQLHELGIRKINGDIIADDTYFDQERYSEDTTWKDESAYYGAAISALTVAPDTDHDTGTVKVMVNASSSSGKPEVKVVPETDYVTIQNNAVIAPDNEEAELEVTRTHGSNDIVISGSIATGANEQEWVAVWEPTEYVLHLFQDYVKASGIQVEGITKTAKAPMKHTELLRKESAPLKELLIPYMKLSNNGHAEMFLKHIGSKKKAGNWEDGINQLEHYLDGMQLPKEKMVIRDGSGLSHVNGITARQLTTLLTRVQQESWFQAFKTSLPVAGKAERMVGGTLRNRFVDTDLAGKIEAKTGTLTGVSSLSGYMETKSGERVVFSILLNGMLDEDEGPVIEEEILKIVYEELKSMHTN